MARGREHAFGRHVPSHSGAHARARCAPAAIFKTHDALRADLTDLGKALAAMEVAEASEAPRGSRVRDTPQSAEPRCAHATTSHSAALSMAARRALARRGAPFRAYAAGPAH